MTDNILTGKLTKSYIIYFLKYLGRNEEVSRIILTRPAIEAGEKLGFLPGDLQSKVDPYLRPLYDALYQIMGADSFAATSSPDTASLGRSF